MAFRLKLKEAIARATMLGHTVEKNEIAAALWPDSAEKTQRVNFGNLYRGVTKNVSPEWVIILCEKLKCSSDFLFGLEGNNE